MVETKPEIRNNVELCDKHNNIYNKIRGCRFCQKGNQQV